MAILSVTQNRYFHRSYECRIRLISVISVLKLMNQDIRNVEQRHTFKSIEKNWFRKSCLGNCGFNDDT